MSRADSLPRPVQVEWPGLVATRITSWRLWNAKCLGTLNTKWPRQLEQFLAVRTGTIPERGRSLSTMPPTCWPKRRGARPAGGRQRRQLPPAGGVDPVTEGGQRPHLLAQVGAVPGLDTDRPRIPTNDVTTEHVASCDISEITCQRRVREGDRESNAAVCLIHEMSLERDRASDAHLFDDGEDLVALKFAGLKLRSTREGSGNLVDASRPGHGRMPGS